MTNRVPLFVAIGLLLLPMLYVGSYLGLVVPGMVEVKRVVVHGRPTDSHTEVFYEHYRLGGGISRALFWPLEQMDRKYRPDAWEPRELVY